MSLSKKIIDTRPSMTPLINMIGYLINNFDNISLHPAKSSNLDPINFEKP
ncbi:MAG: hypothetical protein ACFE9C_17455 [Candidatus Hodarchaeota archaeon]